MKGATLKSDLLENFENNDIYSIILCGGSGTRLWPLSRKSFPKQFLSLGEKQKTLLQLTIDRVKNLSPLQNRWLVTAQCQENLCANHSFYFRMVVDMIYFFICKFTM